MLYQVDKQNKIGHSGVDVVQKYWISSHRKPNQAKAKMTFINSWTREHHSFKSHTIPDNFSFER